MSLAPLSLPQERLWILAQMEGGNAAYNEAIGIRFRGSLDREVLARSLDALTARHEVLRTRLVLRDGSASQCVDPASTPFPLVIEDLSDRADATERLTYLRVHEHARPFAMGAEPLVRARLIVMGPREHVLLLTIHHIIFDGWSRNILLRELGIVYSALRQGEDIPLPELTVQYTDHAQRQMEWLSQSEEPAAQTEYWRKNLSGVPALLDLPSDRPRPARQDYSGDRVPLLLDERLTTALRALADRCDVTLYSTILTGWAVLLSLLSGQRDIVVGAPTANRRRGGADGLMGFFVNTLAVRVNLSDGGTVEEALRNTRRTLRSGLANVDLPFERVVELIAPRRSAAHTPLFQTMFAWVPTMHGLVEIPGVEAELLDMPFAPAKFDLVLALADEGPTVVGDIDFATSLFDRETVERYSRYLIQILRSMAERPEGEVADLSLLDPEEQRMLVTEWSWGGDGAQRTPDGNPAGLVERFEAQVRLRPDQDAVLDGTARLDYASLDRRANRLAHALIARGTRPGDVVGLHTDRTVDLVVGVLGILKAGAAFLPLDPGQPPERLAAMVAGSEPALVITRTRDDATPVQWPVLSVLESESDRVDAPRLAEEAGQLAYVIHTSGSTGLPKGVAVTRGSVLNLLDFVQEAMGRHPGQAAALWSSMGFDSSVHEMLAPLTTGAVLHIVPEQLRGDPAALMAWLREREVTQAFLPPSYVTWIDEDPVARLHGLRLRALHTGVESLPESALHRIREALPGLRICFGYGPTEATVFTTAYTEHGPVDRPCPIGRPLPGTRLYLLDARMRPVPPGVTGEIHIGGASLAAGYLNRPDLTEERFVPDPFVPGERLYRTGDLARWLPDGNAVYVGRLDDQVKLRGFRVEPGEVESALLAIPGVHEAVVLPDHDSPGGLRLVAGVGRGDAPPMNVYEWRRALSERVPDYMIPSAFAEFANLPINRNGKVDRAVVLKRADEAPDQVNTAAPRDSVEMAVYRIWRELLLHPAIGITDDFFALGGTSISAIKVAHAIRERFGRAIPVREIMLHPTIEALAARLRDGDAHGAGPAEGNSLVELRPGTGPRVICVHPAGGTAFCYLPLAAALPGDVNVLGLQAPGIEPGETTLPSIEAMAATYARLVAPRPGEALVLCGLSFGGLIAHEMGRLFAAGGHPTSVVLLDTHGTDPEARESEVVLADAAEFREKLVRFNGMYPGIDDAQIERYLHVYNHHRTVAHAYDPAPSQARLALVQATDSEPGTEAAVADRQLSFWERRARAGLIVTTAPCGHWDLLESDGLPTVARTISAELDRLTAQDSRDDVRPVDATECEA
ncbi:amino acid adenylation domain-containing protein [Streptomyces parvulus]|nr:amino acid adenylation domain-containing protein [Streptomyces parvulus]